MAIPLLMEWTFRNSWSLQTKSAHERTCPRVAHMKE